MKTPDKGKMIRQNNEESNKWFKNDSWMRTVRDMICDPYITICSLLETELPRISVQDRRRRVEKSNVLYLLFLWSHSYFSSIQAKILSQIY